MPQAKVTSKQFSLSLNDFWKGLLIAIGSPVITILIQSLNTGELTFNWKAIATTGLSAGLMYLAKNFFDKPKVVISDAATVEAVKEGTSQVTVTNTK